MMSSGGINKFLARAFDDSIDDYINMRDSSRRSMIIDLVSHEFSPAIETVDAYTRILLGENDHWMLLRVSGAMSVEDLRHVRTMTLRVSGNLWLRCYEH